MEADATAASSAACVAYECQHASATRKVQPQKARCSDRYTGGCRGGGMRRAMAWKAPCGWAGRGEGKGRRRRV